MDVTCGGQLSGSQLTGRGTTAATRVPRWRIGERPRAQEGSIG